MNVNLKEAVLPHFLAILSFYLIVILYFSPIVFEGKMIFQSDILQWEGSAKELLEYRERTGEEALWTNSMFGGMPAYLIHLDPKGDITNTLIKVLTLGLPHPISGLFFGMVSMYLLLMGFKVRPAIAALAAWAFAFNTFNFLSLEAGHNAKIWSVCIVPLLLAGVHLSFTNKKFLGLSLTALAVLLQLKFNHLQITYYSLILVLIYGAGQLIKAIREKQLIQFSKITALLLAAAMLGGLGNLARLSTVLQYGQYSIRGERNLPLPEENDSGLDRTYAFNWSSGKLETFTLLIPNYLGGASQQALPDNSAAEQALRSQGMEARQVNQFVNNAPSYWGDQPFTGGPIYGGAIMIFLFVLGILFATPLYRNVLLVMTLITLMLSWGKNLEWFNYFLFDYLPGYNKFRAVSMALGITLLVIPILGALGLERLFSEEKGIKTKATFFKALGITGGLVLLALISAYMSGFGGNLSSYPDWLQAALKTDRRSLLHADTLRSLLFIGAAAVLLGLALYRKLKTEYAIVATGLLLLVDLWGINGRYLDQDSFSESPSEEHFAASPADEKIMQDEGYFRVLNLQNPFNDARTSYRFHSIGGYHGAKMSRYQDLIERVLQPEISAFVQKAQEGNFDYAGIPVLNMLNTRYIMAGRAENAVFQNPQANGAAWFPEKIIAVSENEEEIRALAGLDTKKEATYNAAASAEALPTGSGSLNLDSSEPGKLVYSGNVEEEGLAVFSEIFYPEGWQARVNGNAVKIHRVNYLLRGLVLPRGEVKVEMEFEPSGYYRNRTFSAIFQYAVLLLVIAGLYVEGKKIQQA
ncbi:hypothetical protein SAMN04488057_11164 [Cyclobacterium lianum]|uniref:Membrane protein YfhO n=1 Tax=Cyclobacterium lianum TaxID=388280 RepID=A0A1M7PWF2_9BACT|nr:hypothetical protein [Cyclobacterium lianum]SHN21923.1 hypothetical protein SAMN04488057_11164 [Cyclobacterium lianum]